METNGKNRKNRHFFPQKVPKIKHPFHKNERKKSATQYLVSRIWYTTIF